MVYGSVNRGYFFTYFVIRGGPAVKVEFDMDDSIPVYEVEIIEGESKYEVKIHAESGKILEVDMESVYD